MTAFAAEFIPLLLRAAGGLAAAALLAALLIRVTRIRSAGLQQTMWLLVLLQAVVLVRVPIELPWATTATSPTPTTRTVSPQPSEATFLQPPDALPAAVEPEEVEIAQTEPDVSAATQFTATPRWKESMTWQAETTLLWALGAMLFVAVGLAHYAGFCRIVRKCSAAPADWQEHASAVLREAGIRRSVPLIVTDALGPALCRLPSGCALVVPEKTWRRLSEDQRRSILLHEAAHFRRGDLWLSLLARLLTVVQWFNPCAWWALARFHACAEWACDQAAAAAVGPADYARTLMDLGSNPRRMVSFVHGAQTGTLFNRVQRVLATGPVHDSSFKRFSLVAVALALLLAAGTHVRFVTRSAMLIADDTAAGPSDPLPDRALLELGDRRLRHRDFVEQAVFSPDGHYIASACANSEPGVRIWNAQTGRQEKYLAPPDVKWAWNEAIAFSPDSRYVAAGDALGYVALWDVESEKLISRVEKHKGGVSAVAFRPGSTEFATGGADGWIRVFDISAPAEELWFHVARHERAVQDPDVVEESVGIVELAFTPDGERLIVGLADAAMMMILNADSGGILSKTVGTHGSALSSISVTPDGERVITSGFRRIPRDQLPEGRDYSAQNVQIGEVRVWDSTTGAPLSGLGRERSDLIRDEFTISFEPTALSPDGSLLACGDFDFLRLRDAETGEVVRSIPIPGWWGESPAFSPDGSLVAAPLDNCVGVWNVQSGERVLNNPASHDSYVTSVIYSSQGDLIATASADGSITLWDAMTSEQQWRRVLAPDSVIYASEFSPDGQRIIAVGLTDDETNRSHGTVVVWSTEGEEVSRFHTEKLPEALAVSPDGGRIAVPHSFGSIGDTLVDVWQIDPPRKLAQFPREADTGLWDCEHLAFTPDGQGLWTAEGNSHVTRWDLEDADGDFSFDADWRQTDEQRKDNKRAWLGSAAFTDDGVLLVTSWEGSLFIWKLATGEPRGTIRVPGVAKYFGSIEIGPDSRTLAAAEVIYAGEPGTDTIRLFDLATQEQVLTLQPDNTRASCFAFSPDMQRLVSGFSRGTAMVWDVSR